MVIDILRGVAQLVARLLWEQDAAGSNPVTPIERHVQQFLRMNMIVCAL